MLSRFTSKRSASLLITPTDGQTLASAYQAIDDFSHAREAYQKGLDLDPQNEADNLYFIRQLMKALLKVKSFARIHEIRFS